jgi:hypothetical protein
MFAIKAINNNTPDSAFFHIIRKYQDRNADGRL